MSRNVTRVDVLQVAVRNAVGVGLARMIRRLLHEDAGATAVEYGLVASLIFLAIVAPAAMMSPQVKALYESVLGLFQ